MRSAFLFAVIHCGEGGQGMLGWLRWSGGRKAEVEETRLLDLPVMVLYLPERLRGHERKISKALALLTRRQVSRLLVPPGFEYWPLALQVGLRPVDTQGLRCALVPAWTETVLGTKGLDPKQTVLCLRGEQKNPCVARAARLLCPIVRNLVIDAPGGETLTAALRQEFGLPVLPARSTRLDLTLRFDPGPILEGAVYGLQGTFMPDDCERLPLLSALWESGRIRTEEITLQIT